MVEFIVGVVMGGVAKHFWGRFWTWLQTFSPVKIVVDLVKGMFK